MNSYSSTYLEYLECSFKSPSHDDLNTCDFEDYKYVDEYQTPEVFTQLKDQAKDSLHIPLLKTKKIKKIKKIKKKMALVICRNDIKHIAYFVLKRFIQNHNICETDLYKFVITNFCNHGIMMLVLPNKFFTEMNEFVKLYDLKLSPGLITMFNDDDNKYNIFNASLTLGVDVKNRTYIFEPK